MEIVVPCIQSKPGLMIHVSILRADTKSTEYHIQDGNQKQPFLSSKNSQSVIPTCRSKVNVHQVRECRRK